MSKSEARAKFKTPSAKQARHDAQNLTLRELRSNCRTSCRVYLISITTQDRTEIAACSRLSTFSNSTLVTIQASPSSKWRSKELRFPCNIRPPRLSLPTSNTATTRQIPSKCTLIASLNLPSLLRPASHRATHTRPTRMRGSLCLTSVA